MSQGQCLLWPVDSLNRTSIDGIEDSDYGPWETSNKGQRSALTVHDEVTDVWLEYLCTSSCQWLPLHPLSFFEFLTLKDSSSTQPSLHFSPLSFLVNFGITFTSYHDAQMPFPALLVLLNDQWPLLNVFSDLLDIRLSLIIFGPALIVPP